MATAWRFACNLTRTFNASTSAKKGSVCVYSHGHWYTCHEYSNANANAKQGDTEDCIEVIEKKTTIYTCQLRKCECQCWRAVDQLTSDYTVVVNVNCKESCAHAYKSARCVIIDCKHMRRQRGGKSRCKGKRTCTVNM